MRLADFIETNARLITDGAAKFAATQAPSGVVLDTAVLRDHIPEILAAIVLDLRTPQTARQQRSKSEGRAPVVAGPESAASYHGRMRARSGFDLTQMVAEYRALRAAVLRLWIADQPLTPDAVADIVRFNEAMDQAVAESVEDFSKEANSWRQIFLGVLGHDLRGPLSVIVSTSELMSRTTRDAGLCEQIDRIGRSGDRMAKLLDDLLDFSRTTLGMGIRIQPADNDLRDALNEEIDLLRAALPAAKITFETSGPTQGRFDASRIREALCNLVNNAAKYGNSGADIRVTLTGGAEAVDVAVSNHGSVVPASELPALFEPLQRGRVMAATGERASLGLGLFIVREIAKAHGGEVNVTSGEASTIFTMRLPRES